MKKFFLISMLFLRVLFSSAAQTGPVDLVLLLDVSASMSSSYGEVRDYLSGPFLREFLRFGDTFHIISFSETPGIEIVRRVEGRGDLETVIGRLFLMYPVEPYSDIAGALNYAERYISFLPENRPKKIVIITDGDESMRPGAASGGAGISPDTVDAHVAETAVRLRKAGADLYLVRVPLAGRSGPSPGREPLPSQRTETATAAPARPSPAPATVPAPAPATPRATAPEPAAPQAAPPARSATPAPAPATPRATAPEPAAPQAAPPARSATPAPAPATPRATAEPAAPAAVPESPPQERMAGGDRAAFSFPSLPILIMLGILLVLIIALIVFLIARRLHGNPTKAMAYAMGRSVPHKEDALPRPPVENKENAEFLASYAAKQRKGSRISGAKPMVLEKTEAPTPPIGNIMVSLFVEDQNTAIGRRNIHNLKPGNTYTIGGGASDFLIFLVPIPPRIAELRYDGRQCTFVPRRPEFFPDTGSQPVNDCIGKTIRVVSEKNYELFIRAEWYQDPIISLNRLLNSVNLPV